MTIESLGIELEGAWHSLPDYFFEVDEDEDHGIFRHDGSVSGLELVSCRICGNEFRFCQCSEPEFQGEYEYVGEIASKPFSSLKGVCKWIEDYYPIGYNKSTGIHLHVKPRFNEYMTLVWNYKKFNSDYLNFLEYFGHSRNINPDHRFWNRLKGSCYYCSTNLTITNVKNQLENMSYDESRYKHVNFSYSKHGTLELRSFPVFKNIEITKDIIRSSYDFINIWLLQHKQPKQFEGMEIVI